MRAERPFCVFCEIVAGRAPCSRVYEDESCLGVMGIRPINPGELMLIPKQHVDHFCDIPDAWTAGSWTSRAVETHLALCSDDLALLSYYMRHGTTSDPKHNSTAAFRRMGIRMG